MAWSYHGRPSPAPLGHLPDALPEQGKSSS
jgi:hypothetical protein